MISVIIPAYNAERTIAQCLGGVRIQRGVPHEIIVVDDASTDLTPEIVEALGTTPIRHPENLGPAAARNTGVAAAKGDLLVLLDSDSVVNDPYWLAKHAHVHVDWQHAIVGGGIRGRGHGVVARADGYCHWATNVPHGLPSLITDNTPRVTRHIVTNNMSLRRATFDRLGPFDPAFRTGEDVDYCERALAAGVRLLIEPGIIVAHQDRESFGEFLRCFERVGRDRVPLRRKHPRPGAWLMPRGVTSAWCLAPMLIAGLWFQTIRRWWPHQRRVVFSTPLILLAYAAMIRGIIRFYGQ